MHGLRGGVMPLKSGENGQMPPSKKKKKKKSAFYCLFQLIREMSLF